MYCYCRVYVLLLLCMFCSVYSVSLCFSVYCFCVNVYCTAATGRQTQLQLSNISYHIVSYLLYTSYHMLYHIIYHIMSCHITYHIYHVMSYIISHIISCHVIYIISYISFSIISCHIYHIPYHIMSCHIIYHAMSYHIISYIVSCHISYTSISCHVTSGHIISCPISYIMSCVMSYHIMTYHKSYNLLDINIIRSLIKKFYQNSSHFYSITANPLSTSLSHTLTHSHTLSLLASFTLTAQQVQAGEDTQQGLPLWPLVSRPLL